MYSEFVERNGSRLLWGYLVLTGAALAAATAALAMAVNWTG